MNATFSLPRFGTFGEYFGLQRQISQGVSLSNDAGIGTHLNALKELLPGTQNWEREFIRICCEIPAEKLQNFFTDSIPKLIDALDLIQLKKSTNQIDVSRHASEKFKGNLPPFQATERTKIQDTSKNYWLFGFISNFFDAFITSFNFFDGSEPPTTIYEKHVLIQIYYRFFQIPLAIACLLQPIFINAWKVYAATIGVLGLASIAIDCYKFLRPFPSVIPHCENIEEIIAKEFPGPITGLDKEMGELLASLNSKASNLKKKTVKKKNIMLVAGTGSGKTTLIYKLHQMIKKGQVPAPLKNKRIVVINGGEMMAKNCVNFGDKIKEISYKLKGFEKNAIVFIDEIQAFASNSACFEKIKEFIRTPEIQFITATTIKGVENVKKSDFDHSFRRSFHYIPFAVWDNQQVKTILEEIAFNETDDILFEDEAINKTIELSNSYLNDLPQPGKAIKLLDLAINSCRTNYDLYQPQELTILQMELRRLQHAWARNFPHNNSADEERMKTLSQIIAGLVEEQSHYLKKSHFLQTLIIIKNKLKEQTIKDGVLLSNSLNKIQVNESIQKRYLFNYFYLLPILKKIIDEKMNELKGKMDLKVDGDFVQKIFNKYRVLEEDIHIQESDLLTSTS